MLDCISVNNMRESDRHTIENFVPSLTLMQRAAMGVFRAADWHGRIAVAAGSGNNGGDGFALAAILRERGYDCRVYTMGSRRSPDAAYYAEKAAALGVEIAPYAPGVFKGCDMLVDCLLGTGFQGAVRADYAAAIREINESDAFVVSVDINSGMDGDTGEAELAVRSDRTVTVGYVKRGLVTPAAGRYVKRLVCADIGIRLLREEWKLCRPEEWNAAPPERRLPWPTWLDGTVIDARED